MIDIDRETNLGTLRGVCHTLDKANRHLVERANRMARELAELKGLDSSQLSLELPQAEILVEPVETAEAEPPRKPKRRKPQKGHGPTPQPELPIEKVLHQFDEPPDCSVCGETMDVWVGPTEVTEEISVVQTTFKLLHHHRQKYRCRCNSNVVTAPGPPKLIPGGRYAVEFAAHSAVSKFCDHMPLERQVRQMGRQGLVVTSQTLWDQQAALAEHLEPVWKALCARALSEEVLHVDETGWRMFGAKKSKWSLFGLTSEKTAAYRLMRSKSADSARKVLKGFRGTLVVDGFAVYPLVAELEGGIRIAHCWAHADRKFKDAKDPPESIAEIRSLIHQLYEIERQVEGPFPGDDEACAQRLELRRDESKKVVKKIRDWAFTQGGQKRSSFGQAVGYLLKHWKGLTQFLDNPKIALDNNAAERALRGPVVGRKNFYGNRSRRGAKVAAILYTLIETAKLHGIDPFQYLLDAAKTAIRQPGTVLLPD